MRFGNLRRNPARSNPEAGYFLLVIMLMVAVMAIVSLAHVENVVTQLKHDREEELVHRGAQYARAIKKYYKKFGQYPVSLDQLDKSNNMRFLRKRYKDPITGEDFRLIRQVDFLQSQSGGGDNKGSSNQSNFGTPIGGSGPTIGGGPFIGVASTSPKASVMEFNNKNHYKDWMFVYLPNFDRGGLIKGPYVPTQLTGGNLGTPVTNIVNQPQPNPK